MVILYVVHDRPILDKHLESAELLEVVKQAGSIRLQYFMYQDNIDMLRRSGCTVNGFFVSYDPKKAAKLAASRKTSRNPFTMAKISIVQESLEKAIRPAIFIGCRNSTELIGLLTLSLATFNKIYGKNAHRRFKPWQDFVEAWANDKVGAEQKFNMLTDFMTQELAAKRRKPLPDEYFVPKESITIAEIVG